MWPIKFSSFSWLGVVILSILVWSNLKNQTILSMGVNNLSPTVVYAEKENTKKEALPFSQNNWLQKVQQDIALREYHINYAADKEYHQSPNRANNTRVTYYPKSIRIAPRTLEEYEAAPPTEPNAERKLCKTFEDYTLQLEVKGYGTTKKIVHPFHAEKLISENNEAFAKDEYMQVEYINNEQGTRQNFIIHQPIIGNEVAVHLNINTSLTATQENIGSIKFTGKQNSTQLYYNDLKVWDATGKTLAAQMKLSNEGQTYALVLEVNTTGAKYPITIDPIVASGNLTNADWKVETNAINSFMGNSVSSAGDVNGDGYSDVIVAAYGRTSSFSSEGAVYIYHGSATGLSTSANRTILGGAANLWFGSAVATAGDINADGYSDVLIGSDNYTNGQTNEGAVYIYHGSASGIAATPTSIVESNVTSAYMGREVSTAGDVNGDGYSDIVVGAESFNNGQSAEGAFWIYQGSASGINSTPMLFVESNQASWWMGKGVGCAGDINGDGYSDVLIGLYGYTNGQTDEGGTYVYYGSSTGITSATPGAILEGNAASARMGESVSSAGDVNGDGYSDVVVGLLGYANGQSGEGAAYIYHGSASGINTTFAAKVEPNVASAAMGTDVGCAGDVNGDGYSDIVVGAYNYTNGQSNEGAIFIYKGSSTGINTTAFSMIQPNSAYANLGISNSSAGDVNGDGYSDVIAGAYFYSNGQTYEGGASVYHGSPTGIGPSTVVPVLGNSVGMNLGTSVASAGDVNGDGYNDVIVGAQSFTNGQSSEGAFFIYHGTGTGINSTPATVVESNQAVSYLGRSVSCAGDVNGDGYSDVVVGAFAYTNGQSSEGAAFIYHGSASGISTTAAVMLESNQASSKMGHSVASAGDVNGDGYSDVVVGAYNYTNGQTNEGAAYIHHGSASGISSTPFSIIESNIANTWLGYAVAGAGDVNGDGYSDIILGANYYANGQSFEGAFYVHHGSSTGVTSSAAALVESNSATAQMGFFVSGAGDVNGDGYSDVLVGASSYENGQTDEGAVFVYHGGSSGINTTAAIVLESNLAGAEMGRSVASAGDVNGDGYSDVIVGIPYYTNVQNAEGISLIYQGSNSGISSAATQLEYNQVEAAFGYTVAGAGDVNRDGYSDVIMGAPLYDNGVLNEGAFFVYHGNAGTGRRNNVQLYNTDLSTPLQQSNLNNSSFGLGMFTTSPQGRQKVKMVWEVKNQGQPFSSAGGKITNSVSNTSVQSSYSNTGLTGTNLNNLVSKSGFQTKVRCRVQYDLVTSVTGQKYGPWRYPQGYFNVQQGMGNTPFPVEWLSFNAQWFTAGESAQLNWSTASEINNSYFTILRSIDGQNWEEVAQVNGAGSINNISNYTFIDNSLKHLNTSTPMHVYYRLMQTDYNGQFSFSEVRELTLVPQSGISVSPNPGTNPVVTLSTSAATDLPYTIIDIQGKEVGKGEITKGNMKQAINLQHLPTGVYLLNLQQDGKLHVVKMVR